MAGNRVEELESKVRELEATVSGLTDELVETKERLQTLEEHTELGLDDVIGGGARMPVDRDEGSDGPATQEDVDAAVESADPGESAGSEDTGDGEGDEPTEAVDTVEPTNQTTFIDADEVDHGEEADAIGPEGSADETNSGESEGGGEESDTDDIIVA